MEKVFTVFLIFSDYTVGIGQYKIGDAKDALKEFIHSNESLQGYDRDLLLKSIMPLTQLADEKGVWLFNFNPDLTEIDWPDENPTLIFQIKPNPFIKPNSFKR